MWDQCQSKHHIHSESELSDCLHYNGNLCIFGYSRFIRYILLTTRAEMIPNLIWAPRNLGSKNLVTKKFGPKEIWARMNFIICHFHSGAFFLLAHIFQSCNKTPNMCYTQTLIIQQWTQELLSIAKKILRFDYSQV